MAAVLIRDEHGTEIVFFDNGLEVHKASNRMIRINSEMDKGRKPRKFIYENDKEFEEAWDIWKSVTVNKDQKFKKREPKKVVEPEKPKDQEVIDLNEI